MRNRSLVLVIVPVFAALAAASLGSGPALARTAASCNGSWQLQTTPLLKTHSGLAAVSAVSTKNAWAVGYTENSKGVRRTLVEHWNGSKWSVVASPNVGSKSNELDGVSARASNDVWAVGYQPDAFKTLVEHWNGSRWSVVPSPNVNGGGVLFGVVALTAQNVWAVGDASDKNGSDATLAMQWDGSAWHVVTTPNAPFGSADDLSAVSAAGPDDVWAVGQYADGSGHQATLTLHFDGASWSVVSSQDPSPPDRLRGVVDLGANEVWAVGIGTKPGTVEEAPIAEHYTGSWTSVPPPDPKHGADLFAVSASSASDVWAVGGSLLFSATPHAVIDHWNGSKWSTVPAPGGAHDLAGVDIVSAGHGFAVGGTYAGKTTAIRLC